MYEYKEPAAEVLLDFKNPHVAIVLRKQPVHVDFSTRIASTANGSHEGAAA